MTVRMRAWPFIVGILAVGGWGCATTGGTAGAAGGAGGGDGAASTDADAYRCPAEVPGTEVEMLETEHGVALVYTTSQPEMVDVLRQKVHALPGEIAKRQSSLGSDRKIPRVTSSSDDVDEGAQVVILPMLPEDKLKLQNYAHQQAPQIAEAQCPEEDLVQ